MDLRRLRYFQAVAEELSYSKAAHRLHIAQPALSRAVKELEDLLGTQLLHRTRRSVSLTPAGATLLNEAGLIFQQVDESLRRTQRVAAGDEGLLRLGFIGPPTQRFLGRIVREFRQRHPRVSVALEQRTPERVCEMVARGRLAVGLTRPVLSQPALGLASYFLRREVLSAVLPQEHPLAARPSVSWRSLGQESLIILARREGVGLHDAILAACQEARFAPRLVHTPSVIDTVLSHVEAGSGIGIVPESVDVLGHGRPLLFRRLTPKRTVDLVMVWSEENDTPAARAFRRLVEEWRQQGWLWTEGSAPNARSA